MGNYVFCQGENRKLAAKISDHDVTLLVSFVLENVIKMSADNIMKDGECST